MKKITHVRPVAEGFDAYGFTDAGAKIKIPIRQVRCGAIPPMESSLSFYYLILGQRWGQDSRSGKEPLVFISEFAGESQEEFFRKLGDDIKAMQVKIIYADFKNQRDFYVALYQRFCFAARVNPAPFAADVSYGKTLILEWLKDGALIIPKQEDTVLKAELQKVADDERSGKESLAFHALRFVLGGFNQDPPRWVSFSGGRPRISGIV